MHDTTRNVVVHCLPSKGSQGQHCPHCHHRREQQERGCYLPCGQTNSCEKGGGEEAASEMIPSPSADAETLAAVVEDQDNTVSIHAPVRVDQNPRSDAKNQTKSVYKERKRKNKQ